MLSDFKSFCLNIVGFLRRQVFILLLFILLGGVIGIVYWVQSEELYRQEILVGVNRNVKKEIISQVNFLDSEGEGDGDLLNVLDIDQNLNSKFSGLKAENVQDTSICYFNVRYFVVDTLTKVREEINAALFSYLNETEPSVNFIETQLFLIPSSKMRSVFSFIFLFLSMGIVIGMYRDVRSQNS